MLLQISVPYHQEDFLRELAIPDIDIYLVSTSNFDPNPCGPSKNPLASSSETSFPADTIFPLFFAESRNRGDEPHSIKTERSIGEKINRFGMKNPQACSSQPNNLSPPPPPSTYMVLEFCWYEYYFEKEDLWLGTEARVAKIFLKDPNTCDHVLYALLEL